MDTNKQLQQVIAKCWEDSEFKAQLKNNPQETLTQEGVSVPEGKEIKVMENTDDTIYLVIPEKPDQISDEDLSNTAGGICCTQGCFC